MGRSEWRENLLFLQLLLLFATPFPSFAVESQDVAAVVNSSVTLHCRVPEKITFLSWLKGRTTLTLDDIYSDKRYSIASNLGRYDLKINPVRLSDKGIYNCMIVTKNESNFAMQNRYANLTVLMPLNRENADNRIIVECGFEEKKTSEKKWMKWFGDEMAEGFTEVLASLFDYGVFTNTSVLKFTLNSEYQNTTLNCQVKSSSELIDESIEVSFNTSFIPGEKEEEKIANVHKFCDIDFHPSILTFSWFVDDYLINGDDTTPYGISNINQHYQSGEVKCQVSNFVDGHQFMNESKIAPAGEGTVSLICNIYKNPLPATQVVHKDSEKMFGNLKFSVKVNNRTSGQYTCEIDLASYEEVISEAAILQKLKPQISIDTIQFGIPGKDVHLRSIIHTPTKLNSIVWSYNGSTIDVSNNKHTILEDFFPQGIKSTLVIRESSPSQFGSYNCSVSNAFGSDTSIIILKELRAFPLSPVWCRKWYALFYPLSLFCTYGEK